jgi:hypothetical protein
MIGGEKMKATCTVYLELECEIDFWESTDDDKHFYPYDLSVVSCKGNETNNYSEEIPKWLNDEILKSNEDFILYECQDVLDKHRAKLNCKRKRGY